MPSAIVQHEHEHLLSVHTRSFFLIHFKRFCVGPPGRMSDMRHVLEIRNGNQCEIQMRSVFLIDSSRSLQRPNDVSLSTIEKCKIPLFKKVKKK